MRIQINSYIHIWTLFQSLLNVSSYLFSKYFKICYLPEIFNKNSNLEDKMKDSPMHMF